MLVPKEKQIRKCIVTNQSFNKTEMIRIVSFQKGPVQFDLTGKAPGRGCYISAQEENLVKLIEKNCAVIARTFKKQITKEEVEYIKSEFSKVLNDKLFRPKQSKNIVLRISKDKYNETKDK